MARSEFVPSVSLSETLFVQDSVKSKADDICADVDKLESLIVGCAHYQCLRFCQATRLQYVHTRY